MKEVLNLSKEYKELLSEIGNRFKQSQIKAASKVNVEMLEFYFWLGGKVHILKDGSTSGNMLYQKLSKDLIEIFPDVRSFSVTNIKYMQYFYELYSSPQVGDSEGEIINPQVEDCYEMGIFNIPWGHNKLIIDKCKGNKDRALFYVSKTIEDNWSRAVLLNFLDSDLYERQGKAITNFAQTLPATESDLAQAITRDPYNFDFLTIRKKYDEKELKDALMDNIERFLLELGNGFAFIGREVRLEIGDTENFIDMLFYNIKIHCYVVVEVKVEEFNSRDMGQLGTYMVAVNHQLKSDLDAPTLGLIICKSKDNVKAQYALEASNQPMGISEYDISKFLPEDFKSSLPTIEEIEKVLSD